MTSTWWCGVVTSHLFIVKSLCCFDDYWAHSGSIWIWQSPTLSLNSNNLFELQMILNSTKLYEFKKGSSYQVTFPRDLLRLYCACPSTQSSFCSHQVHTLLHISILSVQNFHCVEQSLKIFIRSMRKCAAVNTQCTALWVTECPIVTTSRGFPKPRSVVFLLPSIFSHYLMSPLILIPLINW